MKIPSFTIFLCLGAAVAAKKQNGLRHHIDRELAPIVTYDGDIVSEVTLGEVPCDRCTWCTDDPLLWDWWKMVLLAGTTYHIEVNRLDCEMDPIALLFWGQNDYGSMTQVWYSDDINPNNCGPYGDPFGYYTPSVTGPYSLTVANFYSSTTCPSDNDYDYEIVIDPPPVKMLDIDVQPSDGRGVGCLNINDHGKIPVAIFGNQEGDVEAIIQDSLELKFESANGDIFSLPVKIENNGRPHCVFKDVNRDGVNDLMCHFQDGLSDYPELKDTTATVDGDYMRNGSPTPFLGIPDLICIVNQPGGASDPPGHSKGGE